MPPATVYDHRRSWAPLLVAQSLTDMRGATVTDAYAVFLAHVAGEHGFCAGCLDRARLAAVPCPEARAAVSVVETHGVVTWDVPVRGASGPVPCDRAGGVARAEVAFRAGNRSSDRLEVIRADDSAQGTRGRRR
jgi:hypothetical protein